MFLLECVHMSAKIGGGLAGSKTTLVWGCTTDIYNLKLSNFGTWIWPIKGLSWGLDKLSLTNTWLGFRWYSICGTLQITEYF